MNQNGLWACVVDVARRYHPGIGVRDMKLYAHIAGTEHFLAKDLEQRLAHIDRAATPLNLGFVIYGFTNGRPVEGSSTTAPCGMPRVSMTLCG